MDINEGFCPQKSLARLEMHCMIGRFFPLVSRRSWVKSDIWSEYYLECSNWSKDETSYTRRSWRIDQTEHNKLPCRRRRPTVANENAVNPAFCLPESLSWSRLIPEYTSRLQAIDNGRSSACVTWWWPSRVAGCTKCPFHETKQTIVTSKSME